MVCFFWKKGVVGGVDDAKRVVVIADRRVGFVVVDGVLVFVVESENTPKRRRN